MTDTIHSSAMHSPIALDFERLDSLRNHLALEVGGKVKIYLDTKYWILLRDVALGVSRSEATANILELLLTACSSGRVICPIGEDVFYEVTKQAVPESFRATVKLIDSLSGGVCSLSHSERVRMEALAFFSQEEYGFIEGVGCPVWTKLPYMLGSFVPYSPALGPDQQEIQNSFTEFLWRVSLEDLLADAAGEVIENYPRLPDFAPLMNEDYELRNADLKSYQQVFMSEIFWEVERHLLQLEAAIAELRHRKGGPLASQTSGEAENGKALLRNVVCNLFRLKKSGKYFPSLFVSASLSAAIWWDRGRKYKQNDMLDIGHAQIALPYCDFFLTERNLKSIAKAGHVGIAEKFECRVLSEPEEILEELLAIL